ncbi:MAG: hypothetical protein ACI4F7_07785, partial [Acutalibacteraceae bacterium]
PTELEAIGWNDAEFDYINLAESAENNTTIYLENKTNWQRRITNENANKFINSNWAYYGYPLSRAFDAEANTVADLYNGENNKISLNLLIDLQAMTAIDQILMKAGGNVEYWPTKVNFYFGDDDVSIFGKNSTPQKVFTERVDNEEGMYRYDMLPKLARYVRIEILEADHPYYSDKILAVIDTIQINGYAIAGTVDESGVVASFTDSEYGIRADITALSDNDVFDSVQHISVSKRTPTDDEKTYMKKNSFGFVSDIFDIYLMNFDDEIITDIGGRQLMLYIPISLVDNDADLFAFTGKDGLYDMAEFEIEDGFYVIEIYDLSEISVAVGEFILSNDEEKNDSLPQDEENKPNYTEDYVENLDFEESFDEEEENTEASEKPKKLKKSVVKRYITSYNYTVIIIIAVAAAVAVAGATVLIVFLIKKHKKRKE